MNIALRLMLFSLLPGVVLAQPSSAEEAIPLAVGQHAPEVRLISPKAKEYLLSSLVKERPTVLVFFRGGWCPYCSLHLSDLQKVDAEIREKGFQIIAVSADNYEKTQANIDKKKLTYRLFSDPGLKAAQAFGVAYKVDDKTYRRYQGYEVDLEKESGESHRLLPVPSVFLIDQDGIVRFVYSNPDYRIRIKAADLLREANQLI